MRYLSGKEEKEALEYIAKAAEIALGSGCGRAKCGCVIANGGEIVGSGFNGPPGAGKNKERCVRPKDSYHKKVTDKTCCVHAEQRAIMDALRNNPEKLRGSRLYFIRLGEDETPAAAGKPYCTVCSKMALDAGVSEFVLRHEEGVYVYGTEEYNDLSYRYAE